MDVPTMQTPILPNDRSVDSGLALSSNGPDRAKTGVLLLNMGGPDRIETVRPFLYNLFGDAEIISLPGGRVGQFLLGRLIVNLRLRDATENYRRIGGGSPQVSWSTIQAEGMQRLLNERHEAPPISGLAMRYWHPFADEALRQMAEAGVEHIVGLTLYPHYTKATTGTSEEDLVRTRDRLGLDISLSFIRAWYDHPGYLDLWAARVQAALDDLEPAVRERVHLVVSAHGLPQKFVDRGDPYVDHIKETLSGVLARIPDAPPHTLAFQSRTGPVKWIGPGTGEVVTRLASEGVDAMVVWPISFVSDHIETTYEVDMLFRGAAEAAGVTTYRMVPQFNDDPRLWEVLADLADTHLAGLDPASFR